MSMNTEIYQDISTRTAGDIYIGVVGPVRAGKSTFIKRFMETQVIPNIDNVYRRERAKDELPQSGSGRMVMTAEPKFVPEEAVDIALDEGMRHLTEREMRILKLRFFVGKTQMEVSREIGISQAQVSRLEKAALKQLQKFV